MSCLLELLGKSLTPNFMELILPSSMPLPAEEAANWVEQFQQEPANSVNQLRLAINYAQVGNDRQARNLFEDLLKDNPDNIDAYLGLAAMFVGAGKLDEAVSQLVQAQQHCPQDSRILYSLGLCHEQLNQIEPAIKYYHQVVDARPYLRQARERLAAIYLFQNDYENALQEYLHLQKEHPEEIAVYLLLGQMYLHTEQYEKAIHAFERAITIEPDNFELHDDYVESLIKSGQFLEAIEQINKLIVEQGEFPDNYLRLADLYIHLGNDEASVENYERALALHPGYLEASVKLGTQHLRMGRLYEAATFFNRAVEINDQLISAYVGLALAKKHHGQNDAAQDTLELAGALEPNTHLLFAEMARLQLRLSLAQKNRQEFLTPLDNMQNIPTDPDQLLDIQMERHRQGTHVHPNQADLRYRYALLLRGKGKTTEAIEQLQSALKVNPAFFQARIKLGLAVRENASEAEALDELIQAFTLKTEYAQLHYKLALMYCDKMQFALAVEHFELADENDFNQADVHANLILALQNMGLIDRANASWRAVCELEPQSTLAFKAQRDFMVVKPI